MIADGVDSIVDNREAAEKNTRLNRFTYQNTNQTKPNMESALLLRPLERTSTRLRLSTGAIVPAELRFPLTPRSHLQALAARPPNRVPAMLELGPCDLEPRRFTDCVLDEAPPESAYPRIDGLSRRRMSD